MVSITASWSHDTLTHTLFPTTVPVQVVLSPSDVRVHGGSTLLLTAIGYGTPLPAVSWTHQGVNLTNTSRIKIYESVVTKNGSSFAKSVLEICNVEYSANSEYTVSMSNGITAAFASFNIFVRGKMSSGIFHV